MTIEGTYRDNDWATTYDVRSTYQPSLKRICIAHGQRTSEIPTSPSSIIRCDEPFCKDFSRKYGFRTPKRRSKP